ncbi:unnamed protein product [Vitrella brassicaformis CCMP3155]|uniref:Uncharacterized protein n=1 Tax=Vitrella brassicaformis (strain CCMP3155) TaxID=1169540 RepID=A0A0G4GUA9_VITBC|nr:unnamed protein product [Vitrella brassicaformis CCMP3155]|eukprot:CEM34415.1 unnamed protein product [Vitrella brassicaformis CCMP3155]
MGAAAANFENAMCRLEEALATWRQREATDTAAMERGEEALRVLLVAGVREWADSRVWAGSATGRMAVTTGLLTYLETRLPGWTSCHLDLHLQHHHHSPPGRTRIDKASAAPLSKKQARASMRPLRPPARAGGGG